MSDYYYIFFKLLLITIIIIIIIYLILARILAFIFLNIKAVYDSPVSDPS